MSIHLIERSRLPVGLQALSTPTLFGATATFQFFGSDYNNGLNSWKDNVGNITLSPRVAATEFVKLGAGP